MPELPECMWVSLGRGRELVCWFGNFFKNVYTFEGMLLLSALVFKKQHFWPYTISLLFLSVPTASALQNCPILFFSCKSHCILHANLTQNWKEFNETSSTAHHIALICMWEGGRDLTLAGLCVCLSLPCSGRGEPSRKLLASFKKLSKCHILKSIKRKLTHLETHLLAVAEPEKQQQRKGKERTHQDTSWCRGKSFGSNRQ